MSSERYDEADILARLADGLAGWRYRDGCIERQYDTGDWKGAMLFAGAVGYLAEQAWHHPELVIGWGRVLVRLRTHDADGVGERDFALAERIDALLRSNSPAATPRPHP